MRYINRGKYVTDSKKSSLNIDIYLSLFCTAVFLFLNDAAIAYSYVDKINSTTTVKIYDSKIIEVNNPDGQKQYYWFEVKCDPLIKKYLLKEIDISEYILTRMGSKRPVAPEMILRTERNIPNDTPFWSISSAQIIDNHLWIAFLPIRQPRVVWYVSMPPHPHHIEAPDPYEGGIVCLDLTRNELVRWTSKNGLPTQLVCREVEQLPEELIWGNVITTIQASDNIIIFKTRNDSEVHFEYQKKNWDCIYSGESKPLIELIRDPTIYYVVQNYAIQRLGELHSIDAIPVLVNILGSHPSNAGSDHRPEARDALIEIGEKSLTKELEMLSESNDLMIKRYSRAVLNAIHVHFSDPVNGLRFKIMTLDDPVSEGDYFGIDIKIVNITENTITFKYRNFDRRSFHLILEITNEEGKIIPRNANKDSMPQRIDNIKIEPGETASINRSIEPLPAGKYKIKYHIDIPKEYAEEAAREYNQKDVWYGTVITNEISINVEKSSN